MVVEVGYRPSPSPMPIALLAGISAISNTHNYVQRRSHPIIISGALAGGGLMAVTAFHIHKHGATKDNLLNGMIGSALMGMTACDAVIKSNMQIHKGVVFVALGSMVYYGNEYVARYGRIRRVP